jgi:hypothetical protein
MRGIVSGNTSGFHGGTLEQHSAYAVWKQVEIVDLARADARRRTQMFVDAFGKGERVTGNLGFDPRELKETVPGGSQPRLLERGHCR